LGAKTNVRGTACGAGGSCFHSIQTSKLEKKVGDARVKRCPRGGGDCSQIAVQKTPTDRLRKERAKRKLRGRRENGELNVQICEKEKTRHTSAKSSKEKENRQKKKKRAFMGRRSFGHTMGVLSANLNTNQKRLTKKKRGIGAERR